MQVFNEHCFVGTNEGVEVSGIGKDMITVSSNACV